MTNADLLVPLHPELAHILSQIKRDHFAIVPPVMGTSSMKRSERQVFPNNVSRTADAGSSLHEIMAITGHETMAMVARHTKKANQERNANAAMKKLLVNTK